MCMQALVPLSSFLGREILTLQQPIPPPQALLLLPCREAPPLRRAQKKWRTERETEWATQSPSITV